MHTAAAKRRCFVVGHWIEAGERDFSPDHTASQEAGRG
jgi:hypothetical protein